MVIRLNSAITLEDFKRIFYMEWGHRVLGRVVGLAFVGPLAYYALRRKLSPGLGVRSAGIAVLIGLQGALGWYMVKSGLEDTLLETPGAVPRVSQYRLAAHLVSECRRYAGGGSSGSRPWYVCESKRTKRQMVYPSPGACINLIVC